MTYRGKAWWRFCACGAFAAACFSLVPAALGQNAIGGGSGLTPAQEMELEFADRLLAAGLPDYSRQVLEKINLPPEIMDIRKVQSFAAQGKFKEAEELVASRPGDAQGAWTLKLALADGYYAWGQYDKARALYDGFFKKFPQGPEEALKPFYLASAYKYAQMMLLTGNPKAAAEAYRMALKSKPEKHIARQLQSELAEVLIRLAETTTGEEQKAVLAETQKVVDEILWVQDVWFGRAIVMLAHMRMITGNVDGALTLVDDYGAELSGIDKALREQSGPDEDLTKLSPMAQCRYMVGVIMHNESQKILREGGDRQKALDLLIGKPGEAGGSGAIQHFLNVFVRYPNTAWAPDAGNRFRQVEEMLKQEWKKEVKAKITPEQWAAVEIAQFREARALFNQQLFAEASANYEQVLTLFPERDTSVPAMGELAASYIETGDFVLADTVVRHVAERFNKHPSMMSVAGDQVIRIAFKYGEQNEPEKQRETFGVFFEYFKNHPRTVLELFRFAEDAFSKNELDLALGYYQRIVDEHEGKPAYMDALNRVSMIYAKQGKAQEELKALNLLIKKLDAAGRKDNLVISAMYRFASTLRGLGPRYVDAAVAKYKQIEDLLKDETKRAVYQQSPEEAKANLQVLQGAMLFGAISDAMRTEVPTNVLAAFELRAKRKVPPVTILNGYYKAGAVKRLIELVDMFPESSFAPAALSQAGTLNTVIGKADDARLVLQRLQKDYPDSSEAANAVFMIGRNLLEMGMRREAVAYFKQMFSGGGEYSGSQILTAGRELFAAKEYEIAIEAFDRVIQNEKDRGLLEPARVEKGQSLVQLGRHADALVVLEKVLEDYPNSGYTMSICRSASEAYAAVASEMAEEKERFDLFNKAVTTMNRARRFAQDDGVRTELDVGVARIFERKTAAERKFGTAAKADEYRNEAVAAYQSVIMFRDPNNAAIAPHLQDAYAYCLPLMLEMERWDDVVDDAQKYLSTFPSGKHVLIVRQALNSGRVGGGTARKEESGTAPAADAGAAPAAGSEDGVF
jgi:tetratricopeptide (TPR) repeat protein